MKYLSLFSGIEAASVAWKPLSWKAFAFADIDPFCCALLKHHYPKVRNLGDVEKIKVKSGQVDVLVGGSPCQSFSIAGKRLGLDDPRGNMALVYLRIVHQALPRWTVFENVPGLLSSSDGDDFACFLSHFSGWEVRCPKEGWGNAGILSGRNGYGIAWRVLDAQHFGVPQRRRRLFVVGHLGDWRPAAAVLFERQIVQGYPPPSKKKGQGIAASVMPGSRRASGNEGQIAGSIIVGALQSGGTPRGHGTAGINDQSVAAGHVVQEYTNHVSGGWVESDGTLLSAHEQKDAGTLIMHSLRSRMTIRRLTPRECERLQGFPDDWTLVPYRGKPAADGNRYRALGNSMAVPVMRWIGERITLVDGIK